MSSAISLRLSDPTTVGYTGMGRKRVVHRRKAPTVRMGTLSALGGLVHKRHRVHRRKRVMF